MRLNMFLKLFRLYSLTILFVFGLNSYLMSAPLKTLVTIKDFNYDCVPDTLVGSFAYSSLKLDYILWGKDSTIQTFPNIYNRADSTFINYPNWYDMKSYINISSFNLDTIPDIMILIRGKVEIDSLMVDTSLKVIVYGQYGFDSISNINLYNIAYPIQEIPLKAKHILPSQDLSNCQVRGYDFTKVSEFLKSTSSFPPPIYKINGNIQTDNLLVTIVYPNPSQSKIVLKAENIEAGLYTIDIISLNGEFFYQEIVDIAAKTYEHDIDISRLTNGTYFVILSQNNKPVNSVKFIKNN